MILGFVFVPETFRPTPRLMKWIPVAHNVVDLPLLAISCLDRLLKIEQNFSLFKLSKCVNYILLRENACSYLR
jgi:hypothetical protein